MYLEHQWEFAVHILQFCCTSQHYETVEYEHHRTTDGGDTGIYFLSVLQRPLCVVSHIEAKTVDKSEKRYISITNGPMRLIFYSLLVHMSTSKP